jgi:hypothetical protein
MTTFILAMLVSFHHPKPLLLQSLIDAAKIIGLPRLKTMDRVFAKTIYVGDFQNEAISLAYSRKEFIQNYVQARN